MYPDITSTTAPKILLWTGRSDGGLTCRQEQMLDEISILNALIIRYRCELEDTDIPDIVRDRLDRAQSQLAYMWHEYMESRGMVA